MTEPSAPSSSSATAAAAAAAASSSSSTNTAAQGSSSTFIESSSANHIGRNERDSDHEDVEDQDDDDEALFAELDKELDMMEDEGNFNHGDTVANFDMAEFRERRMEELRQE